MSDVIWAIHGREFNTCNCAYGCPCQFNALPTHGHCQAVVGIQIDTGTHGQTRLDGLKVAGIFKWPGPVHMGNGEAAVFVDTRASAAQRESLLRILSGQDTVPGATIFQVFSTTFEKMHEPIFTDIEFEVDVDKRRARLRSFAWLYVEDRGESPSSIPSPARNIADASTCPMALNTPWRKWAGAGRKRLRRLRSTWRIPMASSPSCIWAPTASSADDRRRGARSALVAPARHCDDRAGAFDPARLGICAVAPGWHACALAGHALHDRGADGGDDVARLCGMERGSFLFHLCDVDGDDGGNDAAHRRAHIASLCAAGREILFVWPGIRRHGLVCRRLSVGLDRFLAAGDPRAIRAGTPGAAHPDDGKHQPAVRRSPAGRGGTLSMDGAEKRLPVAMPGTPVFHPAAWRLPPGTAAGRAAWPVAWRLLRWAAVGH